MALGSIDAAGIVSQLMEIERQPLAALEKRKSAAQNAVTTLTKLKTAVDQLQAAAAKLAQPTGVARYLATSSHEAVATASVSGTGSVGALTFRVVRLAAAAGTRSATVADRSTEVTTAQRLAVGAGTQALGVASVRAADTAATGSYQVTTKAATGSGVQLQGKGLPGVPVTVTAGDNQFTMLVDGQFKQVSIEPGTYADESAVQVAVQAAVTAAGIDAAVSIDDGALTFTGGAVTSLGLVAGGPAALGLDAATVTGGASVAVNGSVTAIADTVTSGAVTVAAGAGELTLNLSGAIRDGSTTVKVVDTGDRSLGAVAQAIAGANAGVSASAVNTGSGWLLQLNSNVTGTDGNVAIDLSAFTLGGWESTGAATNALIEIGSGDGAYTVEASGNTFTDVLSGVTITVKAVSDDPVTISVAQNHAALADDVAALVSQVNAILGQIKSATAYTVETGTGGPLVGDSSIRRLAAELTSALSGVVGSYADGRVPGSYGIELNKDGTFTFDKAKFTAALDADPALANELLVGTAGAPGVGARIEALSRELVHWERGLLTNTTKSAQDRVTRFTKQIERLEDRLSVREVNMMRQWASLQTLLANMENQNSWLSNALAGLSASA